jgi:hypothetical protein
VGAVLRYCQTLLLRNRQADLFEAMKLSDEVLAGCTILGPVLAVQAQKWVEGFRDKKCAALRFCARQWQLGPWPLTALLCSRRFAPSVHTHFRNDRKNNRNNGHQRHRRQADYRPNSGGDHTNYLTLVLFQLAGDLLSQFLI